MHINFIIVNSFAGVAKRVFITLRTTDISKWSSGCRYLVVAS